MDVSIFQQTLCTNTLLQISQERWSNDNPKRVLNYWKAFQQINKSKKKQRIGIINALYKFVKIFDEAEATNMDVDIFDEALCTNTYLQISNKSLLVAVIYRWG